MNNFNLLAMDKDLVSEEFTYVPAIYEVDNDLVVDQLTYEQGIDEIDKFYGKTLSPDPASAQEAHLVDGPAVQNNVLCGGDGDAESLPDAPFIQHETTPPTRDKHQAARTPQTVSGPPLGLGDIPPVQTPQLSPNHHNGGGKEGSPNLGPVAPSSGSRSQTYTKMRLEENGAKESSEHGLSSETTLSSFPLKSSSETARRSSFLGGAKRDFEDLAAVRTPTETQTTVVVDEDNRDGGQPASLEPTNMTKATSKRRQEFSPPLDSSGPRHRDGVNPSQVTPPAKKQKVLTPNRSSRNPLQPEDNRGDPSSSMQPLWANLFQGQSECEESDSSLTDFSSTAFSSSSKAGGAESDDQPAARLNAGSNASSEISAADARSMALGVRLRSRSTFGGQQDRKDSAFNSDYNDEEEEEEEDDDDDNDVDDDDEQDPSWGKRKPKSKHSKGATPPVKKHTGSNITKVVNATQAKAVTQTMPVTTAAGFTGSTSSKMRSDKADQASNPGKAGRPKTKRSNNIELANAMTTGLGNNSRASMQSIALHVDWPARKTRADTEKEKKAAPNPTGAAKSRHRKN